jgi:hypothetical protein
MHQEKECLTKTTKLTEPGFFREKLTELLVSIMDLVFRSVVLFSAYRLVCNTIRSR